MVARGIQSFGQNGSWPPFLVILCNLSIFYKNFDSSWTRVRIFPNFQLEFDSSQLESTRVQIHSNFIKKYLMIRVGIRAYTRARIRVRENVRRFLPSEKWQNAYTRAYTRMRVYARRAYTRAPFFGQFLAIFVLFFGFFTGIESRSQRRFI